MVRAESTPPRSIYLALCALLVTIISFVTYVPGYDEPKALFWDENYHISSAQRYLNRVYFLEPHPPLGKMMVALGEYLLSPNEKTDYFIDVEYGPGENLPADFSFAGYRLIPTVLGWLTAPLVLLTVVVLTNSLALGVMASAFYAFDNALIVHTRAAMLDSTQIFFAVLALLSFFTLVKRKLTPPLLLGMSAILGIALGATITTKVTSVILLPLLPLLLVVKALPFRSRVTSFALATLSLVAIFLGVWRLHFLLGERHIPTLSDGGYFSHAQDIKTIVDSNQQTSLAAFPRLLRENALTYVTRYADGVPQLDLCKADENGSPPYFWPLGARTISYRWETASHNSVKYLFLVPNPFSWGIALGSILVCGALLLARLFFPSSVTLKRGPIILLLLALYFGYLFSMSQIARVLYLYHYFMPLIFAYILSALTLDEIDHVGALALTKGRRVGVALLCVLGAFLTFVWYAPLTYYQPLTDAQVRSRSLLALWDLTCTGCERTNKLAKVASPTLITTRFAISDLAPEEVSQDWGQPAIGTSAVGKALVVAGVEYPTAFGMHSNSFASYAVNKGYSRFEGDVGLPDYLKNSKASVVFQVVGDGKVLWESPTVKPGEPLRHIDLDISNVEYLVLKISDAQDGITDDHGFWANLALTKKPGSDISTLTPPGKAP